MAKQRWLHLHSRMGKKVWCQGDSVHPPLLLLVNLSRKYSPKISILDINHVENHGQSALSMVT